MAVANEALFKQLQLTHNNFLILKKLHRNNPDKIPSKPGFIKSRVFLYLVVFSKPFGSMGLLKLFPYSLTQHYSITE